MLYYFAVGSDAITCHSVSGKLIGLWRSVQDYKDNPPKFERGALIQNSTLLDFPEDCTSDINVIELADRLRGNNTSGLNPDFETL